MWGLSREEIDEDHHTFIEERLGAGEQGGGDFTEYLGERLPDSFDAGNVESFASFLLLMLRLEPQSRLSTGELLQAPFVTDALG